MLGMGGYGSGARWMLNIAVRDNNLTLARWALERGANPNAGPPRSSRMSQRALYEDAVMGGLTAVHQFCRIGRFAITGGCSKIVQDVPPFMIADGNPAEIRGVNLIGLERNNYPPESVKLIKEAFRLIYRSKYNRRQAIEAVQKELPQTEEITELIRFIEKSERGITR
jgi:acyl-ACP--UDP-N-acetylglucosamine O-acyltransferase